ncbi:WbqC-like protein family protein [Candidatus Electrothrix gigas]
MKKTVVIHQPDFVPYIGFFHRLVKADLFVALDHVQFVNGTSQAWTHRDKIKTHQGEKWLTISVKKASRDTPINRIELSKNVDWRTANLRQLEDAYRTAPYFKEIFPRLTLLYQQQEHYLAQFNLNVLTWLFEIFNLSIPVVLSSDLNVTGSKNTLLVNILKKVDAGCYLSGIGAKAYYDPAPFADADIEVLWQKFEHPVYQQQHGEFIPFLSCLDLLFNCGINQSRKLLKEI